LSHKRKYVAGVVTDYPVGIDIERIRPVDSPLINRILDKDEKQVTGKISDGMFFRCWTGKEAVLKAIGSGIRNYRNANSIRLKIKQPW
jgi:4'-phosphopantetheinyl transferase